MKAVHVRLDFRSLIEAQASTKGQPSPTEDRPAAQTTSERIRYRLADAGFRFHANDNISAFIEEGELDELEAEVQGHMQKVLEALVIDTESDHNTAETARRVAKMYVKEVFAGRYLAKPRITEFPNVSHINELMIVGPIT